MPSTLFLIVAGLIGVALVFDYINGFHDAANSIATIVSTRVLSPGQAVIWAAFFNFVAAFGFGTAVAKTIGKGMIDIHAVTFGVIFAGLMGAIIWDLITWYFGLPTSSSHALIGGYAGAAVARSMSFSVIEPSGWSKTLIFIILAPMIGLVLGFLITTATFWTFRRSSPARVDRVFRKAQLVSAAFYSLGHGTNDAQKTMGQKIIRLRPVDGFCAETGAAATLILTIFGGVPVSTTHTITGAIVGVGATRRLSAVRWGIAGRIVWAWILTIPMAASMGALMYWVAAAFGAK